MKKKIKRKAPPKKKTYPYGGAVKPYINNPQNTLNSMKERRAITNKEVANEMEGINQWLNFAGSLLSTGMNKFGGSGLGQNMGSGLQNNVNDFSSMAPAEFGISQTQMGCGGKVHAQYGMGNDEDLYNLMKQAQTERERVEGARQSTLDKMQAGNPVTPMPEWIWKHSGGPYSNTCIGNASECYSKAEGKQPIYGNQLFKSIYEDLGYKKLEEGEPTQPGDLGQIYEDNIPEHAMIYTGTGKQTYAGGSGSGKTIKQADWNKIVSNPNINKGIWNYRYVGDEALLNRADQAVDQSLYNLQGLETPIEDVLPSNPGLFKYGGQTSQQVEIEDKEVLETPDGQVTKVRGKDHEQGGINMNLPEGTKVYSDELKGPNGKTMANRKIEREKEVNKINKKMSKLDKYLSENSKSKVARNTYERQMKGLQLQLNKVQVEDDQDMMVQEMMSAMMGTGNYEDNPQAQYGMNVGEDNPPLNPRLAYRYSIPNTRIPQTKENIQRVQEEWKTKGAGMYPSSDWAKNLLQGMYTDEEILKWKQENQPLKLHNIGVENKFQYGGEVPQDKVLDTDEFLEGESIFDNSWMFPSNETGFIQPTDISPESNLVDPLSYEPKEQKDAGLDLTMGDYMGLAGTALGGIGPLLTTLQEKKSTTPNINAYKQFGKDAIQANESSQDYVARMRNNALQRLQQQQNAQMERNRNTAKGINTMRALDLGTYLASNRGAKDISDAYSRQMMELLSQKSQLENVQDAYVMQGEEKRDLADRMDKAAYYNNLAQNLVNAANALQSAGANLNQSKLNKDMIDLIPQLTEYGLGIEKIDGKYQVVQK